MSVSPFLLRLSNSEVNQSATNEIFNPELNRLNTLEKLISYTDSIYYINNKSEFDTGVYIHTLSSITKERFRHGCLNYKYSENWLAALSGDLLWSHLSAIVISEDILKHPNGLCSQQTIVFMKLLRLKNINVRSVGLGYRQGPGHFLCETHYDGSWHLNDISVEPSWDKIVNHHRSLDYYLGNKDSLFLAYQSRLPKKIFFKILEKFSYGPVNEIPAGNMALFHKTTLSLTYIFPALFLGLFIRSIVKKKRNHTLRPPLIETKISRVDTVSFAHQKTAKDYV